MYVCMYVIWMQVGGGGDPPAASSSSYRLTAAGAGRRTPCGFGDEQQLQPMYTRAQCRRLPATTGTEPAPLHVLLPTTSLLRQLTGGGTPRRPTPAGFGYDERRTARMMMMMSSTRSASCPSLLDATSSHQRFSSNTTCHVGLAVAQAVLVLVLYSSCWSGLPATLRVTSRRPQPSMRPPTSQSVARRSCSSVPTTSSTGSWRP